MNLSELRARVIKNTSRDDLEDLINSSLNEALVDIARAHRWRVFVCEEALSVVENDLYVELPSRTLKVYEARVQGEDGEYASPVLITTKSRIVRWYPDIDNDSSGKPKYCYVEGRKLYLCPKADGALDIIVTIYKLPDALEDDADETPELYLDQALIAAATRDVFASSEKFESANYWDMRFIQSVRLGIKEDSDKYPNILGDAFSGSRPFHAIEPYLDPFNKG